MTDNKVVPIKRDEGSSPRASVTQPVARKVSSTETLTPRAMLERLALSCMQTGLDAYRDAARARADGDELGAEVLRDCAGKALDFAREIADGVGEL